MIKKNYGLLLVFISILLGCATTANYSQVVSNWRGKNIQELRSAWGTPDTTMTLPNGNILYVYKREQLYTTPPIYPATASDFVQVGNKIRYVPEYNVAVQGQTVTRYCRTWFETNTRGVIVNAQFQGNNCIAGSFSGVTP